MLRASNEEEEEKKMMMSWTSTKENRHKSKKDLYANK